MTAPVTDGKTKLTLRQLHNKLGHIAASTLRPLVKKGFIEGIEVVDLNDDFECVACNKAKPKKQSVPKVREGERGEAFGDEIHSDIWGPAREGTFGGRLYFISFTDDWSRWSTIYLLREKSEAFECYKSFAAWTKTHMDITIKCLHSDRGGEYLSNQFLGFLDGQGTESKLAVHDTPEENGVSERLNRTLMERVRAMLFTCQLTPKLWGEALMHAVWLKNRTWTTALPDNTTPYELVNGKKPNLSNVPEWGCKVWVLDKKAGKLGPRAVEGRWVGYDIASKGHRIFFANRPRVGVERNVTFSKNLPVVEDLMVEGESDSEEMADVRGSNGREVEDADQEEKQEPDHVPEVVNAEQEPVNPTLPPLRRSERIKKSSQYLRDIQSGEFTTGLRGQPIPKGMRVPEDEDLVPEMNEEISGLAMSVEMDKLSGLLPNSLAEAKRSIDWPRWKEAMEEEKVALEAHGTWKVVTLPKGANVVGCHWTYAIKRDADGNIIRYKARLVAQGFSQTPGVDFFDTYAPVAKMAAVRTTLAKAARRDDEIHQIDIKNAFLNGEFEEREVVYMRLPPEIKVTDEKDKVLQLLRPIYGLRQSARHWYKKLSATLKKRLGMNVCEVDQAVFFKRTEKELIVIVAHVDDLTIVTSTVELMKKVKDEISKDFRITDLGEIHWILGFEVKRDREKRTISLSQASYIRAMLQRYGFENIKPRATPMDPNVRLSKSDSPKTSKEFAEMKNRPYRESVGSLNFAANGTRIDVAYVVGVLSKYLDNPGPAHWEAVKRAFAYLSGTIDWVMMFGGEEEGLVGYADADGSMHEDRKAISGYAFILDGGAVSWSSKRQEIIALSTTEAEYVAITHAAKEALWLRTFISQVFGDIDGPMTLHSDNQSAIALTKDHQYHARTKHIDIRFHFIRWIIADGKVKLLYCPTEDMIADALTKALPNAKVKHFAKALGLSRD